MNRAILPLVLMLITVDIFAAETDYTDYTEQQRKALIQEHCYAGVPSTGKVWARTGYVMQFDQENNVTRWVGYHVIPAYLKTPKRKGRWNTYRNDPDFASEGSDLSYTNSGYARGHLAPYFISGGDRDEDGKFAVGDEDDERTVYEVNYFTNLTPQNHAAFNGSGGVWYQLETYMRTTLFSKKKPQNALAEEVWVYAGTVISTGEEKTIGDGSSAKPKVRIPAAYFKILVIKLKDREEPVTLAFLFPHYTEKDEVKGLKFTEFLVPVDTIELLTGLDFFQGIENEEKREQQNTITVWKETFR